MRETRGPLFVLALVAALLIGTGVAYFLDRGAERAQRPLERATDDPQQNASELRDPGFVAAPVPAKRVAPDSSTPRAGDAHDASAALPQAELVGHVLDAAGNALPGARVALSHSEARTFTVLDLDERHAPQPVAETLADSSGAFRFALPIGMPVDVAATLAGYCDALEPDAYAGQELELVLARGVLVYGRVTRKRDGAGVEGAQVKVFRMGGPNTLTRETSTGPDGSYELRTALRAEVYIEIVPRIEQCPEWSALTIGPDDRCEHDVVLEDGVAVIGRVTAADTGLALAGATVGEGWWYRRSATSDARGEYRLEGFGDPGVRELSARANGYGATKLGNLPAPVAGVLRVDFALTPARAVRGRVVDERGAAVPEAYVAAVASEFGQDGQRTDWLSARTDAAGRYHIDDLAADLGHALLVSKNGYATAVYDLPENELGTHELELGDIVLYKPGLIAGRVEDAAGAGIARVEIELGGWNADRARFTQDKRPLERGQFYVDTRSTKSDAQGRFWFGDVGAGNYRLVTRAEGRPESAPLVIELAPGERREDLRVRLVAGGTIRGQVVGDEGRALAGVYVSVQSERLADPAATPPGHVSMRTAADGRFELVGLPDGEYTLRAYPLEVPDVSLDAPWLQTTLEHVQTAQQELVVTLQHGASIRGRLLDHAGLALVGYVVVSVTEPGQIQESAQTDAEGRFALNVAPGSSWNLEVRGAPQGESFKRVFLTRKSVAAGTRDLELRLEK